MVLRYELGRQTALLRKKHPHRLPRQPACTPPPCTHRPSSRSLAYRVVLTPPFIPVGARISTHHRKKSVVLTAQSSAAATLCLCHGESSTNHLHLLGSPSLSSFPGMTSTRQETAFIDVTSCELKAAFLFLSPCSEPGLSCLLPLDSGFLGVSPGSSSAALVPVGSPLLTSLPSSQP